MDCFECDEIGELKEYIGCKIERGDNYMKATQPVMIKSFMDKFGINKEWKPATPAPQGKVLVLSDHSFLNKAEQTKFWSRVGKLLHMMK